MPVGETTSMTLNNRVSTMEYGTYHHQVSNGSVNGGSGNGKCQYCPYGYHIDRDFVPFTKKMLSREANVERLRELRAKLRSQRKSMDKLLGFPALSPTNNWEGEVKTISRASVDVWKNELKRERERERDRNHQRGDDITTKIETESNQETEDALESSLQAAVKDFEEALNRTRPINRNLTFDIPESQKFHTFPRIKAPIKEIHLDGDVLSMRDKESPCMRDLTNQMMEGSVLSDYPASQRGRSSQVKSNLETYMENETWNDLLHKDDKVEIIVNRMRELEEQVKMIPELQVKVTLLTEEKRQIMKLLENEKLKRSKAEEIYESLKNSTANGQVSDADVNQNVVPLQKKTVLTRDVGSSPVSPTTRSIGVGESSSLERLAAISRSDSSSPTGNQWTMRRRVRSFETGVQCTEHDLGVKAVDPILQIVEKVDCEVQTTDDSYQRAKGPSPSRSLPRMKTIGVNAKPRTIEVGVSSKPSSREIGLNTTEAKVEKPKLKHVGISASLDKMETLSSLDGHQNREKLPPKESLTVATNTAITLSPKQSDEKLTSDQVQGKSEQENVPISSLPVSERSSSPKVISSTSFTVMKDNSSGRKAPCSLPVVGDDQVSSPLGSPSSSSPTEPKPLTSRIPVSKQQKTQFSSGQSFTENATPSPSTSPPKRLATPTTSPSTSPNLKLKSAEPLAESLQTSRSSHRAISPKSPVKPPPLRRQATYTKEYHGEKKYQMENQVLQISDSSEDDELAERAKYSHAASPPPIPPPTTFDCPTIVEAREREKITPSKEMQGALKVLNDALLRGKTTQQVTTAISIILHEWFRVSGTKSADPADVEDYLDSFETFSPQLLRYIVNMPDGNGNTAMHYAVSHGNFDVVSILLDSKVCDPNKANKAGYTSVMLVSLAKGLSDTHRQVVRRLFSLGDVNIKAAQNLQTALMLAASHGRIDTVKLLLEAGADINIQDEDGSTALMCASEHGHGEIVKYFLTQSDCDPHVVDSDGSTALSVAMEAGHKDIGVMLYAHMHFVVGPNTGNSSRTSPNSTRAKKSRSETPSHSNSNSNSPATSNQTSPVTAKKQYSTH